MTEVLKDIDYKKVFYYFEKISSIPRGSKDNQRISDYLVQFAKERNLAVRQDEALNVVIVKEATKGYEHCDTVMLQGHMDMVCIKNKGVEHDFTKEGIDLYIDGDFIKANGTTLGGDDGMAIAFALAILDSDEIVHPRLEVVITTDEEIGLLGAVELDTSDLKAKYLINIDSEEEYRITVGCAGGMTSVGTLPLMRENVKGTKIHVDLTGLQGGHSGVDVLKNRTNAVRLLARLLFDLKKETTYSVFHMTGGSKDNAIPCEAHAELVVEDAAVEKTLAAIAKLEKKYQAELASAEPGFHIVIDKQAKGEFVALTKDSLQKVMMFILYQPNGVQAMSASIEGLPESSLNLGIFTMNNDTASFSYSVRSSLASYKMFLSDLLQNFTEYLGGTYYFEGDYPAWEYREHSKLRDIMVPIFKEQFGKDPEIDVIHAGLECGVFYDKMPDLDIVSVGPDMFDVHTPLERISISSTKKVFDFVVKTLNVLCSC